ncbi:MAG: BamA/TamA family outer membrane protein [Gammaproteobacteria bacterium]|nr:BamA/TamA family outer membrane protein [Gammaproteobacteria bacterium]
MLDRGRERSIAAYSSFGFGIDALDATINDGRDVRGRATVEPDGKFVSWTGRFRWVERLPKLHNSRLHLRLDAQLSSSDLLPMQKFAIGGISTVRGYRENQLTPGASTTSCSIAPNAGLRVMLRAASASFTSCASSDTGSTVGSGPAIAGFRVLKTLR